MFQTNAPNPNGPEPRKRHTLPKVDKMYTLVFQLETEAGEHGAPFSKRWFDLKEIVDFLNERLPAGVSAGLLAVSGGHLAIVPTEGKPLDMRMASDTVARLDRAVIQEALERNT